MPNPGFVEVWRNYDSLTWGARTATGDFYRASDRHYRTKGELVWEKNDSCCVSCGRNHGATIWDNKKRCEYSQKEYKRNLHKVYWAHVNNPPKGRL